MNTTVSHIYRAIFKEMLFLVEEGDLKTLKETLKILIESLDVWINDNKM